MANTNLDENALSIIIKHKEKLEKKGIIADTSEVIRHLDHEIEKRNDGKYKSV